MVMMVMIVIDNNDDDMMNDEVVMTNIMIYNITHKFAHKLMIANQSQICADKANANASAAPR